MEDEKPKIIVDEDWKSQVAREREEAEKEALVADDAESKTGEAPPEEGTHFMHHISDMATQAMFALGLVAPEGSEKVMLDLPQAKYFIDTLAMLRTKTEGNLEAKEKGHITEALSELQRIFAVRAQQLQEASLQQGGIDLNNLKGTPQK